MKTGKTGNGLSFEWKSLFVAKSLMQLALTVVKIFNFVNTFFFSPASYILLYVGLEAHLCLPLTAIDGFVVLCFISPKKLSISVQYSG